MNRFLQKNRISFLPFIHLFHQKTDSFKSNFINVLSNGANGKDSFCRDGRVVKAYKVIVFGHGAISLNQKI